MSDFSQRFGFEPIPVDLGVRDMPKSLENGLWDTVALFCFRDIYSYGGGFSDSFRAAATMIWFSYFRQSVDSIPRYAGDAREAIRRAFFAAPFFKKYEFVEFCLNQVAARAEADSFSDFLNDLLRRERAAFRVAAFKFIQVANEMEVEEVASAMTANAAGVREHIASAARFYSALPTPDYRNSIKESISAVESAVAHVCGGRPNGVSRKLREAQDRLNIHAALWQGFEKIYAYTADAGGIRHALIEGDATPSQEDAKYMLISCSAFSNYLLAKTTI